MPACVFRELLFSHKAVAERLFCVMASRIRELNGASWSRPCSISATGSIRNSCASRLPGRSDQGSG